MQNLPKVYLNIKLLIDHENQKMCKLIIKKCVWVNFIEEIDYEWIWPVSWICPFRSKKGNKLFSKKTNFLFSKANILINGGLGKKSKWKQINLFP